MWLRLVFGVQCAAMALMLVRGQCSFLLDMKFGSEYQFSSPRYPNNYPPNMQCTYTISAPYGYQILLNCPVFQVPGSTGCALDSFAVSRTGRADLADSYRYCGSGMVVERSDANKLTIRLTSAPTSFGGKFSCTLKLSQPACACGKKKEQRIVGGVATQVNEFPMMAALVDVKTRSIVCGATIIADMYVLTAAHCLLQRAVNDTAILVGDHDITTGTDTSYAQAYVIAQFLSHPGFTLQPVRNDIALVRTQQAIQYNPGVGPVCLPWRFRDDALAGTKVTACGWGDLDFGGPRATVLNKVDLSVIGNVDCAQRMSSSIPTQQMCTFTSQKDTCQADSGGPLFLNDTSSGLLHSVGIVSYGFACATTKPSVNTRVTEYLDWIMTNSPSTFYCYK